MAYQRMGSGSGGGTPTNVGMFFAYKSDGTSVSGQDSISLPPMFGAVVKLNGEYSLLTAPGWVHATLINKDGTVSEKDMTPDNNTLNLTANADMLLLTRLTAGSAVINISLS